MSNSTLDAPVLRMIETNPRLLVHAGRLLAGRPLSAGQPLILSRPSLI